MATTIFNPIAVNTYNENALSTSLSARFIQWCKGQQENRLLWLGFALAGQGCFLAPAAIFVVLATGGNFVLFMTALVAMAITLVTNLAAMPTKITIPFFFASILLDVAVVIAAFATATHMVNIF